MQCLFSYAAPVYGISWLAGGSSAHFHNNQCSRWHRRIYNNTMSASGIRYGRTRSVWFGCSARQGIHLTQCYYVEKQALLWSFLFCFLSRISCGQWSAQTSTVPDQPPMLGISLIATHTHKTLSPCIALHEWVIVDVALGGISFMIIMIGSFCFNLCIWTFANHRHVVRSTDKTAADTPQMFTCDGFRIGAASVPSCPMWNATLQYSIHVSVYVCV